MDRRTKSVCLIASLIAVFAIAPQSQATADDKTSCQAFVQQFYDWYIARANAPSGASSPLETALKTRSDVFSPELCRQLKEDTAASAKSPGEIVGLDFDPILNTQEQVKRYVVKQVSNKGSLFLADVYAAEGGKKSAEPDVQPELSHSNGKWQFVNFHYKVDKKSDDLLHILKLLRDERQTNKK